MANVILNTKLIIRNDTLSNWNTNSTTVPLKGELCATLDENGGPKLKIGDGTTAWSGLSYINVTPADLAAYGVKSVEITGSGNAVINASFDQGSGKLTLTKGDITDTTYTISGNTNASGGADVTLTPTGTGSSSSVNIVGGGTTTVSYADGKISIISSDTSKSYNLKSGSKNGTVAFGITGSESDVAVTGLKSAAYTESSAYDAAGTGATEAKKVQGNTTSTVETVEDAAAAAQATATEAKGTANTALQSVTVAGQTLTKKSSTVTAEQIKTAMSLGAAADKAVDEAITSDVSVNLPTTKAVVDKVNAMIGNLGSVFNYKGTATYDKIIAKSDAKVGDVWIASDLAHDGQEYVCIVAETAGAENWEELGTTVDLSGYLTTDAAASTYATKTELTSGLSGKQNTINAENKLSSAFIEGAVAEATHATSADNATTAGSATKATQDGDGNVITTTYATKAELPTADSLGAITSATGQNGITASTAGTTLTVGLNLTDTFILNGGNAAGTYN